MDAEDYAQNEIDSGRADETSWWPSAEFAILQKVYDDCSSQKHLTMCLKGKALSALTRAVEQVKPVRVWYCSTGAGVRCNSESNNALCCTGERSTSRWADAREAG